MESVYAVAQYIFEEYRKASGQTIDEMKLHKLLYFTQRESIAILGIPMFDEVFEGWKYGPVCKVIRSSYTQDGINAKFINISYDNAYIVNNVISEYGAIESWKLSEMSHKELSWMNSRRGLIEGEIGGVPLNIDDIKLDAKKVRPYDHVWDMYYDEFENAEAMGS